MGWIMLGLGIGAGYAIVSPAVKWYQIQRKLIANNRNIGWDVNWRNRYDVYGWKRIEGWRDGR